MCLRTRPVSYFRFVARSWKKKKSGAQHGATGPKSQLGNGEHAAVTAAQPFRGTYVPGGNQASAPDS